MQGVGVGKKSSGVQMDIERLFTQRIKIFDPAVIVSAGSGTGSSGNNININTVPPVYDILVTILCKSILKLALGAYLSFSYTFCQLFKTYNIISTLCENILNPLSETCRLQVFIILYYIVYYTTTVLYYIILYYMDMNF